MFTLVTALLGLASPTHAATFQTCHVTRLIDDYVLEDQLDASANSSIILNDTAVGYRFFFGKASYENWEYCNIEPMARMSTEPGFTFRIDDYKEDLTLYIEASKHASGKFTGKITQQLNPAKPATDLAEIECD